MTDPRPPIAPSIKAAIRDAFAVVPEGKTSAILAIVDEHGPRLHGAVKVGPHWKVGGALELPYEGKGKPTGWVGVEIAW